MKKIILLISLLLVCGWQIQAQDAEKTSPLTDVEITRRVIDIDIEGESFVACTVVLKSYSPDAIRSSYKVKVTVKNARGKTIYKKVFRNAYLYVFSSGQIQVGKPNFSQMVIWKRVEKVDKAFSAIIREKEGVFPSDL